MRLLYHKERIIVYRPGGELQSNQTGPSAPRNTVPRTITRKGTRINRYPCLFACLIHLPNVLIRQFLQRPVLRRFCGVGLDDPLLLFGIAALCPALMRDVVRAGIGVIIETTGSKARIWGVFTETLLLWQHCCCTPAERCRPGSRALTPGG